ncbi:MAG: hypothetical protein H8E57_07990 [Candidatus Cloacimonetes bacterium]|nr:hypothetical protein [Candidatus Cloacimonadota bacterium]
MKKTVFVFSLLVFVAFAYSQTTINYDDLEYEVGGNYSMYDIPSPQGVIGLTGLTAGPHVFDFSTGSTLKTLIFDYVETSDGGHGGDFPLAEVAERKTDDSDQAWMYLKFTESAGRTNYGFHDAVGVPESPSVPFTPPIIDFPDNITYGTWFMGSTSFDVISGGFDMTIEYSFTGFADAWGTIILPDDAGTFDCIQVNYDEQYDYYWMGYLIQTSYLRSYYYLTKETGISTIITSLEDDSPVPNVFSVANTFARLFESSKLNVEPPIPVNLEISIVDDDAILVWEEGAMNREITYNVYSSVDPYLEFDPETWTLEEADISATTWTDETLTEDKKFYCVTAVN